MTNETKSCKCGYAVVEGSNSLWDLAKKSSFVVMTTPESDSKSDSKIPAFVKTDRVTDGEIRYSNGQRETRIRKELRVFLEAMESKTSEYFSDPKHSFALLGAWKPSTWKVTLQNFLDKYCRKGTPGHILLSNTDQIDRDKQWAHKTGVLIAGGAGSPMHLDVTTRIPYHEGQKLGSDSEAILSDAWGLTFHDKYVLIIDRTNQTHFDALNQWACDCGLFTSKEEQQATVALALGHTPYSFQGVHSYGWPTIGELLMLQHVYRVPAHFHLLPAKSWYMILRGTVHCIRNPGVAVSVAADAFFDMVDHGNIIKLKGYVSTMFK